MVLSWDLPLRHNVAPFTSSSTAFLPVAQTRFSLLFFHCLRTSFRIHYLWKPVAFEVKCVVWPDVGFSQL